MFSKKVHSLKIITVSVILSALNNKRSPKFIGHVTVKAITINLQSLRFNCKHPDSKQTHEPRPIPNLALH